MTFNEAIEAVGRGIEVAGAAVMVVGALGALVVALRGLRRAEPDTYRSFRQQLGRSILLGLELLVAADIIRTVAITPTLESVGVLAGIVVIRTFLSFSLELEITGSWPWQPGSEQRDRQNEHGEPDQAPREAGGRELPVPEARRPGGDAHQG
ncbi:DUF1622 domain-containing protein [Cryptosporangium arvum]|uniref:Putative membrane protein n=1 Tax=Cryptosporangium arvum DSM 44712 TaxID=927661 RepID=A0A010ZZF5_9ACTN|nr:DUF1622 domain-containing protein [Cryptosporangium arvum]EXG82602.1 putative membrane protein [Cryptosporangium arvum DSM 44712]